MKNRSKTDRIRIRSAALLIAVLVLLVSFSEGCLSLLPVTCAVIMADSCLEPSDQPAFTQEPSSAPTSAPTQDTSAPTQEPGAPSDPPASPDETARRAIALAAGHGIPESDLFGQYELFLRYLSTVEQNPSLGRYSGFVLRVFPALAENAGYIDEDYFFPRLASLAIRDVGPDELYTGFYYPIENEILMAEEYPEEAYLTVYHELLHFIDDSIAPAPEKCRVLNGRVLTDEEYEALSGIDKLRTQTTPTVKFYSEFTVEAGAELFTAKYFTGAASSYTDIVSFLAGIEYIYGADTVKRIYFSPDSDILMAKLIQDLGYDYTELLNINQCLCWYTDPEYYDEPSVVYPMEDLLIEMYEKNMDGDWREDKPFRYILACINGVEGRSYLRSAHAEELAESDFLSFRSYDPFEWKLLHELGVGAELYVIPPTPAIEDGRFLICAPGLYRDRESGEVKFGALRFDYDFETKSLKDFEFTAGELVPEN